MNRTSVDWTGPMPALTTPFRDNFTIDEAAFASNVDRLFEAGATGMVVAGCTGEFWALSLDERARLARVAADRRPGARSGHRRNRSDPRGRDRRADPCREGCRRGRGPRPATLVRAPRRPRAHPAFRDRRCAIGAAARALQHPRQCRERDRPGAGRPARRSRPGRRHQGERRRLDGLPRHPAPRARPDPGLLRAFLGLRGRRHPRGGRWAHRLFPQRLGSGSAWTSGMPPGPAGCAMPGRCNAPGLP